jgi:hypothetical protein
LKDRTINVRENQPHQPTPSLFVGNLAWEVSSSCELFVAEL